MGAELTILDGPDGDVMRILFIIRALDVGGSQRQMALLARGLARRGHSVAIAVLYSGGALETMLASSDVRLLSLEKAGRWDIVGPLIRLYRMLRSEHPDIVYPFLATQTVLAALLSPRAAKLVFGIRASRMELARYDWLSRSMYSLEAWLSRRADLVVANAQSAMDDAIARGMPAGRVVVIPNGIDTDSLVPDSAARRQQRRQWGIDDDQFVIGMVARLDPMKDHATFIVAAAEFARRHADARFVLVGDGPRHYRNKLKADAQAADIAQRVVWAGEGADMRAICNAFDIACLSSAFGEGFPNVVGEAMACGVPVAATDVGDMRRIVANCGEVVSPRRPELLVAAWESLRQRLSQDPSLRTSARERIVQHYAIDSMVRNIEQAFAGIGRGRPRRLPGKPIPSD